MQTVIERLKASKIQHEDSATGAGRAAGREWAEDRAEYAELVRVATIDADACANDDDSGAALEVAAEILGVSAEEMTDKRARDFWKAAAPGVDVRTLLRDESPNWLRGFVRGARAVYEAVEKKI